MQSLLDLMRLFDNHSILSPDLGTLLPAGALACVWIYGLHRHPDIWENPDMFLPRRWVNASRQVNEYGGIAVLPPPHTSLPGSLT